MTVTRSKIEHASVRRYSVTEKRTPKGLPEYIAAWVGSEAGSVIILIHSARFHPIVSPRIILDRLKGRVGCLPPALKQ